MRINRDTLLRIARDQVEKQTGQQRDILAAFLCGSLLSEEEYLLGGVGDIDLVFIHVNDIPVEREILPLSPQVHLDIAHHLQKEYLQPRHLRVHPWLGPTVKSCMILYDPQHFLDFTQASVRGQFERGDYVVQRGRTHIDRARKIWSALDGGQGQPSPAQVEAYLRLLRHAANAIASLSGTLLAERRFLYDLPQCAEQVGRPGLAAGFLGLLGALSLDPETLSIWLATWAEAWRALPVGHAVARLHPGRQSYYQDGIKALLGSQLPQAGLWPMFFSWTLAVTLLEKEEESLKGWRQVCQTLGLSGADFQERLRGVDAYLDQVEETLEEWGRRNGA